MVETVARPGISLDEWYPTVENLVDTPRTMIWRGKDLLSLAYGEVNDETRREFKRVVEWIQTMAKALGYPLFLRTGLTSGKHGWRETCFVAGPDHVAASVYNIIERAATADFMGLPCDVWVVRKFLHTEPAFRAFDGMPVTRERRYFIDNGGVIGHHPYWPPDAIEQATHDPALPDDWRARLDELNQEPDHEVRELTRLSKAVAFVMPGAWSVDWLWAEGKWWLTDMAWAEESFVWKDWPTAPKGFG